MIKVIGKKINFQDIIEEIKNYRKKQQADRPATLLKKRHWHRCFFCEFCEILRTPF